MHADTIAALAAAAGRDIRAELGLRPIINASGTMTVLGASIMVPQAVAAMAAIAGEFVEMEHLHQAASSLSSSKSLTHTSLPRTSAMSDA